MEDAINKEHGAHLERAFEVMDAMRVFQRNYQETTTLMKAFKHYGDTSFSHMELNPEEIMLRNAAVTAAINRFESDLKILKEKLAKF